LDKLKKIPFHGHGEVAQVEYNASIISDEELLEVFRKIHHPTSLNRQGIDIFL
jgi:peptide-methionine (S)-S-oxide reductase